MGPKKAREERNTLVPWNWQGLFVRQFCYVTLAVLELRLGLNVCATIPS